VISPKYFSLFVIGILTLTWPVCINHPLGVYSLAQSNDGDAIRTLVQRLLESYQRKDLESLISLSSQKSPLLAENKKIFQGEFAAYKKIIVKGFNISQMKIDGKIATLRVAAEMALTRANMVKATEKIGKKNRTIQLINDGGVWKLWKFIPSEEELAAAIIAAKTDDEQKALMDSEPELITSDLALALIRQNYPTSVDQGTHQRALKINHLASKLAEQLNDQWVTANTLMNKGYIYGWLDTPEKSPELSLEYYRRSLKMGEEFGFKEVISRSLINSAVIYNSLGELPLAAEYYQRSLKLFEELGNHTAIIQASNNLGIIHRLNGNFAKALELFLKCRKMSESRLDTGTDWGRLSRALLNIGATFLVQGNDEQSVAFNQMSVEAADKAIMLGDITAKYNKASALSYIGSSHREQGNYSLAMDYFQKSLKLAEEFGGTLTTPKDSFISSVKMEIGSVLESEKMTQQAIASYLEALRLAEKSRDKTAMSYPLWTLARMYFISEDYREALVFAEQAVKSAEETGKYRLLCGALVTTARAYQKLGQPDEAYQILARAIDITEQIRKQMAGGDLDRQRSVKGAMTPYQAMIDFQIDQKRFAEAFSYAQRAKGRTLLELLQNGRVNIDKSATPAEREEEQRLNRKIVSLNRQVISEKLKSQPDEKRLAEFETQLKKARLEFEAFQTTLYAAHPELKVQRGEIRSVSFEDAVDFIPDSKTALLDFIVTDENVHLFVLTKETSAKPTLNTYTVRIERKSLAEKVERFRRRMENRDYDFQSLSKELYLLLIKPAEKQLQNRTNLIISPDSVLWDLPFQTLLSPKLRYLIEDAAISYAPSLSVLREMRLANKKKQAPAKASLLALGNPALGNRSKELVKFVKMDADLQPLPEAAAQVRAIGRLYGPVLSKVLTDSAAREELIKETSARYRILHLATHGILNDVSPMYSHIMLSQTPGKPDEDGLLEAWEMMKLDLYADLVVLAACETARGRVGAGEGVIGMSWALFVAGCPRTVVSQWKVEASSTTALMVEFHKRFKTKYEGTRPAVSTAEAMRQAALKVKQNPEYTHPFYWGGFVVVGDAN
jgi:CHAT domain-containing protein/Tfp pilus assembly protein PilF